jgi:SOS-response transcriptional repressor LexA
MSRERTTKKQQALLQFISDFLNENNYAPSYREIMAELGYKSVSTVAVHVDGLIAKGYLTKSDKSARSVRIAGDRSETEINHLAWLRTEITRLETAGADEEELTILRKAVEILS